MIERGCCLCGRRERNWILSRERWGNYEFELGLGWELYDQRAVFELLVPAVGAAATSAGTFVGVDGEIDFATDDPNNQDGNWDHHE